MLIRSYINEIEMKNIPFCTHYTHYVVCEANSAGDLKVYAKEGTGLIHTEQQAHG